MWSYRRRECVCPFHLWPLTTRPAPPPVIKTRWHLCSGINRKLNFRQTRLLQRLSPVYCLALAALCWLHLPPGSRLTRPTVFVLLSALEEACACIIPVTQTRWRWDLYHLKEKNTMWSNSNWTFTVNKSEFNTFLRVSSSARPHMSDRYCNLWCWRLCSELINVSFPFSVQVTLEMLFYVPDERVSAALIRRRAKWMG